MALNLAVNQGGNIVVTPTAYSTADELTVVIDGSSYSVTGTGVLGTTIDAFITAHAGYISAVHGVLASDGTTVLNLYNADAVRTVTATNATVAARAEISSTLRSVNMEGAELELSSATVLAYLRSALSAKDTVTFTFASASEAVRGLAAIQDFQTNVGRATANGQSILVPALVTIA